MPGCEVVLLIALCLGAGENLLANPGFEEVVVDRPAHWDLFVSPKEGAIGRLDETAFSGKYSVMLHTPTAYEREPANNWSQNIIAYLGGKTLRATGYIKVKEATEAAIWVQCWAKHPSRILGIATTSTDMPVYGTREWEPVALTMDTPKETDFVVLRCVLKGTGAAWFDDIVLAASAGEGDGGPEGEKAEAEAGAPASPAPALSAIQDELARLRDANLLLAEALEHIQAENSGLMKELSQLRQQLQAFQAQLAEAPAGPMTVPGARSGAPGVETAPPLVPHGIDWRMYR